MVAHVEPVLTLLLADSAPSLSDLAQQAPDVLGAASDLADLAGSAQASATESLSSIGNFWSSILDTVSSAKDQAADTTMGSIDALKSQVDELAANTVSPFQRLGEDISSGLAEGLESLKFGAQGAVEGAQTQLGQSVTEKIGGPIQEGLGQIASKFGTSPEELLNEEKTWANGVQQTVQQVERVATPSRLFYAENAAILPLWAAMIAWPEKELTKKVMGSYTPVVLAAVIYMWLTYECFQNPVSLQGFASGISNLPGLTKGFGEEVSVATAWSHFLAEDLFIGRFVYLDGQKNKVFTKHSLLLCYLFGPVGFLSHLLTRGAFSVVTPVRDIIQAGIDQQSTKSASKVPPATKAVSAVSSPSSEAKDLVAKAKREADEILKQARSAGASLLEEAERDSLLILKGAESMSFPYHCDVEVTFPSASLAEIACNTLAVDAELQPDKIVRTLRVEGSSLLARFEATEARTLRVVLSGFYDMTSVVARTFLEFDNPDQDR
eukprot:g2016.t1